MSPLATLLSCRHHAVGSAGEDVRWSLGAVRVTVAPFRLTNVHLSTHVVGIHYVVVRSEPEQCTTWSALFRQQ